MCFFPRRAILPPENQIGPADFSTEPDHIPEGVFRISSLLSIRCSLYPCQTKFSDSEDFADLFTLSLGGFRLLSERDFLDSTLGEMES